MNRVPDRHKRRREYLKRRVQLQTKFSVSMILLIGGALIVLTLAIVCTLAWIYIILLSMFYLPRSSGILLCCGLIVIGLFVGFRLFLLIGIRLIDLAIRVEEAKAEATALVFVPPITPDTLPAEEVLVRGSEPPSTTRDTLLRPAMDDTQTPAEQLLRATSGVGSEQP